MGVYTLLPQFLLAFVRRKKLSEKEVQELIQIISEGRDKV